MHFYDEDRKRYVEIIADLIVQVSTLNEWADRLCQSSNALSRPPMLGYDLPLNIRSNIEENTLRDVRREKNNATATKDLMERLDTVAERVDAPSAPYTLVNLLAALLNWHESQFLTQAVSLKCYSADALRDLTTIRTEVLHVWSTAGRRHFE